MKKKKTRIIVAVSGGFDPIHSGHINLFKAAKKLGRELVVILNNDNWLRKKKGFVFMGEKERKKVIEAVRWVDRVVISKHGPNPKDMSINRELEKIKPHIFVNGGDRTKDNIPEVLVCQKIGCRMIFKAGGGKVQSSSWVLDRFLNIFNPRK